MPRDVITNSAAVRANFAEVAEKKELESLPSLFLPPELQSVLQESGLPQLPDDYDLDTLIWDNDDQLDFGDNGDVNASAADDPEPNAKSSCSRLVSKSCFH